ncbi:MULTISPECIES: HlyD family secretion protein [unclassified Colwellia]|uniref:HlyD family secretion protein n=1 Tax=unclassified Colwellia TaxID=196834 RepID=UPI0015F6D417|nr:MULTISPECIES: HlyD family efflux transporter periplasmic adaptor subunit [unclassified Colwellia]MBA6380470.1 HlyD family efflux transporter periplasmic adaptor subunit [Colwellia sp. BRX10-7]MBA6386395.1 HlyD family efflux transporter periplasmic adaptor subunit [Colwellia sp. BRX10-2]MBA6402205.1 HlyD family efflux transporter periplasmic adaptor subunit [Colwellia sp. BRX10-5]MBA6404313.1 HlyD family efflux transporter periplasmic adaptor subunit [Colwellia sp. BRX10-1]
MYQKLILSIAILAVSGFSLAEGQTPLILSGQIKASDNQTFYSPKTDSWNVQVQWLLPEGDIAEEGDLVVVFDSGSIQSQIEQEKVSLIAANEELFRLTSSAKQSLLEATYGQKRTALLLDKARIDAGIAVVHLSEYDYQKNQLQLEKSVVANAKSLENLKQVKVANQVAVTKQKITIVKHQDKLQYNEYKLKQMSGYAERSGPVLYGLHPWSGEKVFVGMTAQPSWEIAKIPSVNGLYIEAWVHEVDYKNMRVDSVVDFKLDAFPQYNLVATLTEISSQPEERKEWGNDVYYRAVFSFTLDEALTLLPGMSAQLEFTGVSPSE